MTELQSRIFLYVEVDCRRGKNMESKKKCVCRLPVQGAWVQSLIWALKIYPQQFQVYSTMLTIVTMLYIRALEFTHLA